MPRILVVDDDRLIRTLLTSIFEMHGVECATASNGEDALRELERGRFDLVLLDLMMPGVDGFGVLERVARLPGPQPPIMIATAASPHIVGRIPASRIAAVLTKPFDVDALIATARELLGRAPRRRPIRIVGMAPDASPASPRRRRPIPFD